MARVEPSASDLTSWLDEIDLDPASSWLAMGTRSLGDRPWLIIDEQRNAELALRARLLREQRALVLAALPGAEAAVAELTELVTAHGVVVPADEDPLVALGCAVTEDLVVLRRGDVEWEIEAGVVCFPSRWNLSDRIGRPLATVHGPTPGYDSVLADRVTSLLDRLGSRIVRRRNWFVHPDPDLFQPTRPASDPIVASPDVGSDLFLRSERQTLRSLPATGRIVFTIKTQQTTLGDLLADAERRRRFLDYVEQAPSDQLAHRGLSVEQCRQLIAGVG